jgi:hypothetical protein
METNMKTKGAVAAAVEFDEEWYLQRYPAVAEAVRQKKFKNAQEHYIRHGKAEGRIPVPPFDKATVDRHKGPRWEALSVEQLRLFFTDYGSQIRKGELHLGRRHYALGLGHAVRAAIHCGVGHIAAIELGVFAGVGLLEMCQAAKYLMDELGIKISVFGFDRAQGLPAVGGYMDHPEIWHDGDFKMPDPAVLKAKLPDFAQLIIGDISKTMKPFQEQLKKTPLGFAAFDVDLYSSTKMALEVLKFAPQCYLPVVPATFDDSGTVLSHSQWAGEAAAVREFNEQNEMRKIDPKPYFDVHKFYCCQVFDHPMRQGKVRPRMPLSLGKF